MTTTKLVPLPLAVFLSLSLGSACKENADKKKPAPPVAAAIEDAAPRAPQDTALSLKHPQKGAEPQKNDARKSNDLSAQMQEHFAHAIAIKETVLSSNLQASKESLRWLADYGAADKNREDWEPHIGKIRDIATSALDHKDNESMAMTVAQLARECGSCHAALGVTPTLPAVASPPGKKTFTNHMMGHKWALDRMWAGLTTPSDALWNSGADYLAHAPPHMRNLSAYGKDADMAMTYASRVHGLAADALKETKSDRRMTIFGRFLASCAGCHEFPASRPKP